MTVIYDANVLYPNTLRDLLIRLARAGVVRARWTDQILDEVTEALRRNRPDIDAAKIRRLRELINAAVRDCLVTDYQDLTDTIDLPDKDDRHVVAAAIAAEAHSIITWNMRDFPADRLAAHGLRAQTPDDFVCALIEDARPVVWSCIQQIADARTLRPLTAHDVLAQLERDGLIRAVARIGI
ncbi:PIN domain-containing protein [Catellatospora methionotrophica]|nr:PIN domain-containing protein [Catellatospora methionotrophica]